MTRIMVFTRCAMIDTRRSGPLFRDRYKTIYIKEGRYYRLQLIAISTGIQLEAKLKSRLKKYPWPSCLHYLAVSTT